MSQSLHSSNIEKRKRQVLKYILWRTGSESKKNLNMRDAPFTEEDAIYFEQSPLLDSSI